MCVCVCVRERERNCCLTSVGARRHIRNGHTDRPDIIYSLQCITVMVDWALKIIYLVNFVVINTLPTVRVGFRAQELCESQGGRHGLPVLNTVIVFMVSVDIKQHWTETRTWDSRSSSRDWLLGVNPVGVRGPKWWKRKDQELKLWKSRWPCWAPPVPNSPYCLCGRKATLNSWSSSRDWVWTRSGLEGRSDGSGKIKNWNLYKCELMLEVMEAER